LFFGPGPGDGAGRAIGAGHFQMIDLTQAFMDFVLLVYFVVIVCFVVIIIFLNIKRITDLFRK